MEEIHTINDKLASFRKKYYLNLALKGIVLTCSLLLAYFLIVTTIEYNLWLGSFSRMLVFAAFFLLTAFCVYRFLREPLTWWMYRKGLGEQESARLIGSHFPGVKDQLLNLIQLSLMSEKASLVNASIAQKSHQFADVSFESAIDYRTNGKYLKYLFIPLIIVFLIFLVNKNIFTQSTSRIVRFNQEFSPLPPFEFLVENKSLMAFFNEDFNLRLKLAGVAVPENVYLLLNGQRLKLASEKSGEFSYTFEKIQHDIAFKFEASGFVSQERTIQIVNRPELLRLNMLLSFPNYLGRKNETLTNIGNVEVPEGTKISWTINTSNARRASVVFSSSPISLPVQAIDDQVFTFNKVLTNPEQYNIDLDNSYSHNKDRISYSVMVVKDQYPEIKVDQSKDSILFKNIFLAGLIGDDYGLTRLALNYELTSGGKSTAKQIEIPISRNASQQSFFYQWHVDSLKLQPGDKIMYHLQVWDNDGVNGHKSSKSATYVFSLPEKEELKAEIAKSQSVAASQIDKSIKKAKDLRETIDEAQQRLKGKQVLDWQDKKMLENLIDQKKDLDKMINDLKSQNQQLEQKKDSFSDQDQKIKDKSEQIQKLMNDLLDPETKKLFEELEKLLKENSDMNQLQKLMDKMDRKEINLEKELERTLELFKQMQFDYKLDQAISDIGKQAEKQEALEKKTDVGKDPKNPDEKSDSDEKKDSDGKDHNDDSKDQKTNSDDADKTNKSKDENQKQEDADSQSLKEEQEQLQKDFEEFKKELEELDKMGDELNKDKNPVKPEDKQKVSELQEQSKQQLKNNDRKKSSASQKDAAKKMRQMQQDLQGMESSMEMEIDMANLESLRQILHGLIKLSYDQEGLIKEFNQVQQTDPRYIQLSQNQLKIRDDSKVLEDSLVMLSKKDEFLNSIITKEIGELNAHLDKSAESVRERRKPNAASEMQLSMTSINNLALMLSDHYDMMMNMAMNAQPGKGKPKKGKPESPGLSQLQKRLNQKIEKLKNGKMEGRQYSEELAKIAAEQERIRRALQEMQEKMKKEGGKLPGNDLPGKMEQTEMDLVNKQITEQTIKRQKEIETRLLEAEKSMREQDMDEERKGESAKDDYDKGVPKAFEEYLKLKEKEVELLKSAPPKFYPYYKKEVNEYFKRIRNQN